MPLADAKDVSIDSLTLEGQTVRADIAAAMVEASLKRTIDGAPLLTFGLHDPYSSLVESGIFAQKLTAQIDGRGFELVQLTKQGPTLTVTFESLAVAEMRKHKDPLKIEAGQMTRVEFAKHLLSESPWIPLYVSPGAREEKTKVELARGKVATVEDAGFDPAYGGVSAGSSGESLTAAQVAQVAYNAGFRGDALVTAVAVAKAESGWRPRATNSNTNGSTDSGLWQINSIHKAKIGSSDVFDPAVNARLAFSISSGGTNWKPWSVFNSGKHKAFLGEAKAAASGIGAAAGSSGSTAASTSDSDEDTWTCIKRIFAEVGWRAYCDWNDKLAASVYVGPDKGFTANPAELNWTEKSEGVDRIDFDFDLWKATASATVECWATRWQLPPGTNVQLIASGLPNPWLVETIERDLFSAKAVVSLKKPDPELPEPEAAANDGAFDAAYSGDLGELPSGASATQGAGNVNTASMGRGDYAWPLNPSIKSVSSGFGSRGGAQHKGIDIPAITGEPIYASRAGTITTAGEVSGYGLAVYIAHRRGGADSTMGPVASTEETRYAHMSKILVQRGMPVARGQKIGLVGSTGNSSGPHLHFEVRKSGAAVDPLPVLYSGRSSGSSSACGGGGVGAS